MNCKQSTEESVNYAAVLEGGECYREKVSSSVQGYGEGEVRAQAGRRGSPGRRAGMGGGKGHHFSTCPRSGSHE